MLGSFTIRFEVYLSRQLEDDPVYRQHSGDFNEYHTRYVTPDTLGDALRAPEDVKKPAAEKR